MKCYHPFFSFEYVATNWPWSGLVVGMLTDVCSFKSFLDKDVCMKLCIIEYQTDYSTESSLAFAWNLYKCAGERLEWGGTAVRLNKIKHTMRIYVTNMNDETTKEENKAKANVKQRRKPKPI